MVNRSKLYKKQSEDYDKLKNHTIAEALDLLKKMPHVKFDETVEIAFKLGIDPKQSDQNVRDAITLPKGTGKKVSVAVVASGDSAKEAEEAGADNVGMEDLVEKIKGGWLGFDTLIATPESMKQLRPLGKVLGPRGLMPNPKTGTLTEKTGEAVKQAKAGKVEFRADKGACVHAPAGKISFSSEDLAENIHAITAAVLKARPSSLKGVYIISCTVSSTMSPGIKLDIKELERGTS